MKPRYSGNLSRNFWNRVNALGNIERRALYACGVLLQDLEGKVLLWLDNAERAAARKQAKPARAKKSSRRTPTGGRDAE